LILWFLTSVLNPPGVIRRLDGEYPKNRHVGLFSDSSEIVVLALASHWTVQMYSAALCWVAA